jgi:hypothetical protein
MSAVAEILRLIAVLFVALMAPKRVAMACARRLDLKGLRNLAENLAWLRKRGYKLRYPGESLAAVAARIERWVWISENPLAALRHMARRMRGRSRARYAMVVPPAWGAVRLWLMPTPAMCADVAFADSS